MKRLALPVLLLMSVIVLPARAALYDDDAKAVKGGEVLDLDYWWALYDSTMLEEALKTKQPEFPIHLQLVSMTSYCDDLLKKYPNHEDAKKWKARAAEIEAKIDPNADRTTSFRKGFLWDNDTYAQAWVNTRRGKFAEDHNEGDTALSCYRLALSKFDYLVQHPEMLADYPEDQQKWVKEQQPLLTTHVAELDKKLHH